MPRGSDADRVRRRHRLVELLSSGDAGTQDEIVRVLRGEGMRATQTTVSRDLEELGAVRKRRGERIVYTLADNNGPPSVWGIKLLPELVIDARSSGNLVVVRTFPGMAPPVAAILDSADVAGVLGTVAGDDTVLVVAAEATSGRTLASRILALARISERAAT